jgi:hypothetical protein
MPDQDKQETVRRLNDRYRMRERARIEDMAPPSPYLGMYQPSPYLQKELEGKQRSRDVQNELEEQSVKGQKYNLGQQQKFDVLQGQRQQEYESALSSYRDAQKAFQSAKTPAEQTNAARSLEMAQDQLSIASAAVTGKQYRPPREAAAAAGAKPSAGMQPFYAAAGVFPGQTPTPDQARLISGMAQEEINLKRNSALALIGSRKRSGGGSGGGMGYSLPQSRFYNANVKPLIARAQENESAIRATQAIGAPGSESDRLATVQRLQDQNLSIWNRVSVLLEQVNRMGGTKVPSYKVYIENPKTGQRTTQTVSSDSEAAQKALAGGMQLVPAGK